jgi:hypothetical protein
MNRRSFLALSGAAALARASAAAEEDSAVFNLHKFFPNPLKIASIDLLQSGTRYFLRTRTSDGAEGLVLTKNMEDYIPILLRRVIPHFIGKDARDLERNGFRASGSRCGRGKGRYEQPAPSGREERLRRARKH